MNDMRMIWKESCCAFGRTEVGQFEAIQTIRHSSIYQYANGAVREGHETIDGNIRFHNDSHPEIYISSNGSVLSTNAHGHDISPFTGREEVGNDGVIYEYKGKAEIPDQVSPAWEHVYGYDLLPIEDLWNKKFDYQNQPFHSFGNFPSTVGNGNANAPWMWGDKQDKERGIIGRGIFFSDPAYLFDVHFDGWERISHDYVYNPFWTHKVTIHSVTPLRPSNVYLNIKVDGNTYTSERVWLKNHASSNQALFPVWGGAGRTSGIRFSSPSNTIYLAHPYGGEVKLEVRDRNPWGLDDDLGSYSSRPGAGQVVQVDQTLSGGGARLSATIETNSD